MAEYRISAKEYYGSWSSCESGFDFHGNVEKCKKPMQGLIERYSLSGKDVFSVGAGLAFEEFWFMDAGCRLTLNDNGEDFPEVPERLEASGQRECGVSSNVDKEPLSTIRWIIEDLGQWLKQHPGAEFDLIYASGFAPDELRREKIQSEFLEVRTDDEAYHYITWPKGTDPYHEMLVGTFDKLREGGLVIFQHYRGGVYVKENHHYLKDIERQFGEHGIHLMEVHCFRNSTAHLLVTGFKGTQEQAEAMSHKLSSQPAIKSFHGRYVDAETRNDVVKVFEFGNPDLVPDF